MLKVREISCKTILLIILITTLTATTTFADKTAILTGKDYFQTVHQAIEEAEESIYVAMYLEPSPTDNPASILLESLINSQKRGVSVKIILDDSKFNINYNAYKRLKEAGVDVNLDSSQTVLHGKAIVIDSQICILGSFNWSRASLYDNYEFATYIEDQQQAKTPSLGMTITTLDRNLQKVLEPYASETPDRINTLKKAQEKGIQTWVFLGPLIPEFTDTHANLEAIFRALKGVNLEQIYVDRLNPRWGVLGSLKRGLSREDYTKLRMLIYKCANPTKYAEYSQRLKEKTLDSTCQFRLSDKVKFCF